MSTVIATPRRIDDVTLADLNEAKAAAAIVALMEVYYPGESFIAVPGGEANGSWNLLVAGNGFALPTARQLDLLQDVTELVLCNSDDVYDSESFTETITDLFGAMANGSES